MSFNLSFFGKANKNPAKTDERGLSGGHRIKISLLISFAAVSTIIMFYIYTTAINDLSGLRAYAGGEGLYSKGQKDATFHLIRYLYSGDEKEYVAYKTSLKTPLGCRNARLALDRPEPDFNAAREGFLEGQNHIDDVDTMAELFVKLRNLDQIDRAVDFWQQADALIEELQALGEHIHADVNKSDLSEDAMVRRRAEHLDALTEINSKLSDLERNFSKAMGDASRWAAGLVRSIAVVIILLTVLIYVSIFWSVNRVVSKLVSNSAKLEEQNWFKTGQSAFSETIREVQEVDRVCSLTIRFLCERLDAKVGAFYIADDDGLLRLKGSYAFSSRKALSNEFAIGRGLVGQAALERAPIQLSEIPDDYIEIQSGLGKTPPKYILVYPIIKHDTVLGVVEFGALHPIEQIHLAFLGEISPTIAAALQVIQSQAKLVDLLADSQLQSTDLQFKNQALTEAHSTLQEQARRLAESQKLLEMQSEELHVTNAELEEQTRALKNSEAELKAQQELLQVINEELEERNKLLGDQKQEVETARAALAEKAEMLSLANRYKSEFLANMSHELRTPLNSLLLLARSLVENKNGNLSDDEVASAEVIYSSGNDLLSLISDILDLSKIEAGKIDIHMNEIPINRVVDHLHKNFGHMAEAKGLFFQVIAEEKAPSHISTDLKRLYQILKNLVSNAIKFTEKGGIKIRFYVPDDTVDLTKSGLVQGNTLAVSVTDTGIGIDPDQQQVIFEAFQQADSGTARRYEGTGLGLSISRELAGLLGGEIQLQSEKGSGAVFTVYLPIQGENIVGTHQRKRRVVESLRQSLRGSSGIANPFTCIRKTAQIPDDREDPASDKKTILVIEDDADFGRILIKHCHEKGFNCLAAETGEQGIDLARQYLPRAIILDISLPGMDGWQVLETLKDDTELRHIPVHIISAEEPSLKALRKGAVGHIQKPVSQDGLAEVLSKLEAFAFGAQKRILLVEDNKDARSAIISLVGGEDVRVDEAPDGRAAVSAMKTNRYDCIIMDLSLTDMDGEELLSELTNIEGADLPPIIVHTGRTLSCKEELNLREYTDTIIIKDVRSDERLLDEVSLFLHRVVDDMPKKKQQIIKDLHNSDKIFQNKTVLIVDDDMRTAFALSRILSERGVRVLKAENGERALALLSDTKEIDLVLMDIMMPVMDGYETITRIRADKKYSRLPIIALTAKAMKGDKEKCLDVGASDYLTKPIEQDRLLSMMRVWLYG